MFCNNCGKEIDDKAFVCPHCGVKIKSFIQNDEPIGGLGILCFLIPIIGLVLYLVWQDNKPIKSKGAGKAAIWGFVLNVIIISFVLAPGIKAQVQAQASESNHIAVEGDLNNLASSALAFYKTPSSHGGGSNSWTTDVDNVGEWLGYDYIASTNTLTTENGSFYLLIYHDVLTIEGTGIEIGDDGINDIKKIINISGEISTINLERIN